jgi:hypothetical protein
MGGRKFEKRDVFKRAPKQPAERARNAVYPWYKCTEPSSRLCAGTGETIRCGKGARGAVIKQIALPMSRWRVPRKARLSLNGCA